MDGMAANSSQVECCPCHGEPWLIYRGDGGRRRCRVKRVAQKREAQSRYYRTEKGGQASDRYDSTRIRVQVDGCRTSYRVPADRIPELKERLATFRADQAANYKEAASGGFHQAITGA